MNMSDDVAGAVMQVSAKGAEEAIHVTNTVLEAIYKLLHHLAERDREKRQQKTDVTNNEITDLKNGKVSIKDLTAHCRKTGEQLVTSEIGITKEDMHYIASKAKKYGIPIAFRNEKGKDNIYAMIRKSDVPLLKQISTENIKEKLASRPQELANFKCKEWEIPFINAELSRLDLSAQFAKMKNGEFMALYEAKDAKAIEIARSEFVRKVHEVENNIEFSKDNDGFFTIKDKLSGNKRSFDDTSNKKFISCELQKSFGFDENKANIAAQKFGSEMLAGDAKSKYFSDDPLNDFSYMSKISWNDEDVLAKAYDCYYVTPKEDGISRIVYQRDDERFAVLDPPRQTKAMMRGILEKELGITDVHEQDALIAKAEYVSKANAKYRKVFGNVEDIYKHDVSFTREAFDMTNTAVVSGMLRTDETGNKYTKTQPIDSVSTEITRKGANEFEVKSTAIATETDQNGQQQSVPQMQQLILSFSNKKTALEELKEMYISQGVPEAAAKDMAKNVYQKAELQAVIPVLAIERTNNNSISFVNGNKKVEVSAVDRAEATEALSSEFGISKEDAAAIMEKADELVVTSSNTEMQIDTNINDENNVATSNNGFVNDKNGHELHPEGNILSEKADKLSDTADKAANKIDDMAEKLEKVSSRGGR